MRLTSHMNMGVENTPLCSLLSLHFLLLLLRRHVSSCRLPCRRLPSVRIMLTRSAVECPSVPRAGMVAAGLLSHPLLSVCVAVGGCGWMMLLRADSL
jgi:hypothetical protein